MLPPTEDWVPALGLEGPTPGEEKEQKDVELVTPTDSRNDQEEARTSSESIRKVNGDSTEAGSSELTKAERRYEGRPPAVRHY